MDSHGGDHDTPRRTCVGCRQRAGAEQLLRVVVTPETSGGQGPVVVPDPRRRMPGRGAWVHPATACVDLAVRRRAFARALRVPVATEAVAVAEYVAETEDGYDAGGAHRADGESP